MAFDAFYYTFQDGKLAARIKGNRIIEQDGKFEHGSFFADDFVIRHATHIRIEDFHSSERDQLVFETGYGIITTEQLMSFVTDMHFTENDFVVNFGGAASITLVGVHEGQISLDDIVVLS